MARIVITISVQYLVFDDRVHYNKQQISLKLFFALIRRSLKI
jgi:hypothetical protein